MCENVWIDRVDGERSKNMPNGAMPIYNVDYLDLPQFKPIRGGHIK